MAKKLIRTPDGWMDAPQSASSWHHRVIPLGVGVVAIGLIAAAWIVPHRKQYDPQVVAAGRVLFEHQWKQMDPLCVPGDGLGPVFNATSCVQCHFQGGVGGSGSSASTVSTFQIIDSQNPDQLISSVIHKHAVTPELQETSQTVHQAFGQHINGDRRQEIQTVGGCTTTVTITEMNPMIFHTVDSPPLFGLSEIERISEMEIFRVNMKRLGADLAADFQGQFDHNRKGIAGRTFDGRVGKFGWKGQFATVGEFIANACAMELGLSNHRVHQPIAQQHQPDVDAKSDMTPEQLDQLVTFVRSLPRPRQIMPTHPADRDMVIRGEAAFNQAKCNDCHVRKLGDVDGIYTDLMLHRLSDPEVEALGGGYSNNRIIEQFDWPQGHPTPDHWKTPPLWGVADSAPYMHDGTAPTLQSAIERHHRDAEHSRHLYHQLPSQDRQAVIKFLESLRAPQAEDDNPPARPHRTDGRSVAVAHVPL